MEDRHRFERQPPGEREKWEAEASFREREISVREQEQRIREAELELKRKEGWRSPLVLAVLAAAIAARERFVAWINGIQERDLERTKAEDARILEMIETGDPEQAAVNLEFLLGTGLILNAETKANLGRVLIKRRQLDHRGDVCFAPDSRRAARLLKESAKCQKRTSGGFCLGMLSPQACA
jgi:hypothetical protein